MAQSDRDVLFANEAYLIGVLQAVSGSSLVAALSQANTLIQLAGRTPLLLLLTAMAIGLLAAVLAAYWKHEYKIWDVKGQVSASKGETGAAQERGQRAGSDLWQMRWSMKASLGSILLGFTILIVAIWIHP
jgi:hypothetical protein